MQEKLGEASALIVPTFVQSKVQTYCLLNCTSYNIYTKLLVVLDSVFEVVFIILGINLLTEGRQFSYLYINGYGYILFFIHIDKCCCFELVGAQLNLGFIHRSTLVIAI